MTINTITQYQIMKELDASCKKDSEGFAVYKSKCNDESIAEKFKVNVSSVATYRKKLIGNLRLGSPKGKRGKNVTSIVNDLTEQVKSLDAQLKNVLKQIAKQQQSATELANDLEFLYSVSENNLNKPEQKQDDESIHARSIIKLP